MGKVHSIRRTNAEIHPYTREFAQGTASAPLRSTAPLALHTGMKFISNDCSRKSEAGYTQSGLPRGITHAGTISSLVLEPGCYMSQEHHEHDV